MKKILTCLLLLLSVTVLFGCNEEEIHEHTFEYVQYEESHCKLYTCGCPSPEIAPLHSDNNNDNKCDVCGYELNEKHNTCSKDHSYDDGIVILPLEQTPDDVGEILYTCNTCGHIQTIGIPQMFSFTCTFGFDGYYNSETGELRNGYNHDLDVECKTTLFLEQEELLNIYRIFLNGKLFDIKQNFSVGEDLIEPSYTIKISYVINGETVNFKIWGASYISYKEWESHSLFGNAYYKVLNDFIFNREEYKSLPPNQNLYE